MRYLILGSIVISQLGFVAAYMIFVAQNLQVNRESNIHPFADQPSFTSGLRLRYYKLRDTNPCQILPPRAINCLLTTRPCP